MMEGEESHRRQRPQGQPSEPVSHVPWDSGSRHGVIWDGQGQGQGLLWCFPRRRTVSVCGRWLQGAPWPVQGALMGQGAASFPQCERDPTLSAWDSSVKARTLVPHLSPAPREALGGSSASPRLPHATEKTTLVS